jgi:FkbM family methyltransferase
MPIKISGRDYRRHFFDDFVLIRSLLAKRQLINAHKFPNLACFVFDPISSETMVFGRFEKDLLDQTFDHLKRFSEIFTASVAVDVGANIGNHSIFFAERFKSVFAIEASPKTFKLLSFNIEQSELPNITALNVALGERHDSLLFSEHRTSVGRSGIISQDNKYSKTLAEQDGKQFIVQVERGDEVIAANTDEPVSLIKIDVEGFETSVIRGLKGTIVRYKPMILLEQLATEVNNGTTDAIEVLRELGYQSFFHLQSTVGIRQRYARLLYKLIFGDHIELASLSSLGRKHYPLIVCCHGKCDLT